MMAVAVVAAAVLALAITPLVRRAATALGIVDHPGLRKVHSRSTARLGGVAVVCSAATALGGVALVAPWAGWNLVVARGLVTPLMVGAGLVFVVGLWDDVRGLSVATRLMIEAVAALLAVSAGVTIDHVTIGSVTYQLGFLAIPVTLAWILTVCNAFNLIDGLDGLATGLAAIASATCAAILLSRGHPHEALLLVSLLGALVGFLPYNFNPASIFLGDSGSLVIGFVLGTTAITGWQKGATVLATGVPLLIFAIPMIDVCGAIARRWRRGGRAGTARFGHLFEADQEHIHHRLMSLGLSHRTVVLVLYALALGLSVLAILTSQSA